MPTALILLFVSSFAQAADPVLLNGAGATFPYPLYSKWFSEYRKVDETAEINYQSVGSGGGVRQLIDRTIDFGASDAPMNEEQEKKAKEKSPDLVPVLHLPMAMGAVVLTYNLPRVSAQVKLAPEVVAEIFLGKVARWNDPKITATNPDVALPALDIAVVHRSDASGTTAIFTDYLAKVSPEWKSRVGQGPALKWPAGLGGKGNEGVSGVIKNTPASIGYVEFIYAESVKLPVIAIKNKSGQFVMPSVVSVTAAAESTMKAMPEDLKVSLTDPAGKASYPIAGLTYLLVYSKMEPTKGKKLIGFLNWALKDGQKMAAPLSYAPLPAALVAKVEKKVKAIKAE